MRLSDEQRVKLDVAERRALEALDHYRPTAASRVTDRIWPGHNMKAQGSGAAASRILKRLEKKGQAIWIWKTSTWGWVRQQLEDKKPVEGGGE